MDLVREGIYHEQNPIRHFRPYWQIASPAYRVYCHNITKLWRDFRTLPDYGFTPDLDVARKSDVAIVGTAEAVRDEVGKFFEQSGCNYLVLSFAWGGLRQDESRRSLERFVTQVMPQFVKS